MKKEYETFVEELRESLVAATGYQENRIYFKKKEDYPQTSGDRIFVECCVSENTREVCGLYAEDLYEEYLDGETMEAITNRVLIDLERMNKSGVLEKAKDLDDYEKVKSDLFIRLLNLENNREDLKGAIHRSLGDIALVLYMKMGSFEGILSSFKVREDMIDRWDMDSDEVFDNALLNTYFKSPPRIYRWERLIFEPDYSGDNFMNLLSDYHLKKDSTGNCLSTTERTNGAVAVFLPGVAERLGTLMGSGFYMVFTSIHEVMIHNDKEVEVENLRRILKDTVREATPEEDFLSFYIYHYDRETGRITWE